VQNQSTPSVQKGLRKKPRHVWGSSIYTRNNTTDQQGRQSGVDEIEKAKSDLQAAVRRYNQIAQDEY
jgi:hypothetical protein